MEMKIDNSKFYFVRVGQEEHITDHKSDGMAKLKALLKGKKLSPDDVQFMEVTINKESEWVLSQITWSEIAMELMR